MLNRKILEELSNHEDKVVDILSSKNWNHFRLYFSITEKYSQKNLDEVFEKDFCKFYILNGARGLNNTQKEEYFKMLSSGERNTERILISLYKIKGYGNLNKLHLSFTTKLIHTIDRRQPIYDNNIATILDIRTPKQEYSLKKKIVDRVAIYSELKNKTTNLILDTNISKQINTIRKKLANKAKIEKFTWRDDLISREKILDSILWALYTATKK